MAHYIIRRIRLAHCKKGPSRCALCREMDSERICLLDIDPVDAGTMQRRVMAVELDGETVWKEFDVVRVFDSVQAAQVFAEENGVQDVLC